MRSLPLLLIPLLLLGAGCQSPPSSSPSASSPSTSTASPASASLQSLAGTWNYTHVGPPTVWSADLPDPANFINAQMQGSRITIAPDGATALTTPAGETRNFLLQSPEGAGDQLRLQGQDLQQKRPFSWIYERSSDRLVMPLNLKLPETQGTIPAYFDRSRS